MASSVDWNSIPGKDWATLTRGTERKIYVPGVGWQFPATINKERQRRGLPLLKDPGQPAKPTTPPPPPPSSSSQDSQDSSTQSPTPTPTPSSEQKPEQKPETKPQDTSKPEDPMEKWRKANPRLAEVERLRKQQRDAGKSVFDKEFRQNVVNPVMYGKKTVEDSKKANPDKPTPTAPVNQSSTPQVKTNTAVQRVQAARTPISSSVKPMDTSKLQKKLGTTAGTVSASYEYEPYDLVLEYLFSQGHVESLDEALYVMMEMDSETIQSICEAAADQSDKQIEKGVKTTYKAGNVLDNLHQGRSRGLNRLSPTERAEKVKRMRKRLKARRDDLFGERNRREDAAREEMRRKYGL